MLDQSLTQGVGLYMGLTTEGPRLIAVASHGDYASEMALLWDLCDAMLVAEDPSLLVLDGTKSETTSAPGLIDAIDAGHLPSVRGQAISGFEIIPSMLGFQRLCKDSSDASDPAAKLCDVLQHVGLIVAYAAPSILGMLLGGRQTELLLPISSSPASKVSAYQTLKRVLPNTRLRPTIAAMEHGSSSDDANTSDSEAAESLQDCAMYFLGHNVNAVDLFPISGRSRPDIRRTLSQLLERAAPLQPSSTKYMPQNSKSGVMEHRGGSH